jgi:hypothetical protein
MTAMLIAPARPRETLGSVVCWDPASECTMTMAEPSAEPDLFAEYHAGAVANYARFGVADAIDSDTGRCAQDTALFWAMKDVEGRLVGGVRAKGPLTSPDDSHAVIEWAGQPGQDAVREMIADRLPFGVMEMKSAWISNQGASDGSRAKLIARCVFHGMVKLDANFCLATSAEHILKQWRSSGGVIAPIPATPYPDDRYRTKMLWWDRTTFMNHGDADQVTAIVREMAHVHRSILSMNDRGRRYAS